MRTSLRPLAAVLLLASLSATAVAFLAAAVSTAKITVVNTAGKDATDTVTINYRVGAQNQSLPASVSFTTSDTIATKAWKIQQAITNAAGTAHPISVANSGGVVTISSTGNAVIRSVRISDNSKEGDIVEQPSSAVDLPNAFGEIVLDGLVAGVDAAQSASLLSVTIGTTEVSVDLTYGQTLREVAEALADELAAESIPVAILPGPMVLVNIPQGETGVRATTNDRTLTTSAGAFVL